jgi:hypothetical protein
METPDFKKIFNDLSEGLHMFEMRDVNLQQLTSHLEELYLLNQELQERIESLEKELEHQKEYAMEQNERYG